MVFNELFPQYYDSSDVLLGAMATDNNTGMVQITAFQAGSDYIFGLKEV